MQHIGIAAITAEGAALVYRHICHAASNRLGEHHHPEISLHTFSLSEHLDAGSDRKAKWSSLIMSSAQKLQASGANFMICPSNTPHDIYDDVVDRLPIPWLHIVQPIRQAAQLANAKQVLLLGTRFTLESDFYDRQFRGSDIELVRTDEQETTSIHDIINRELIKGIVTATSQQYLSRVMSKYASMGVDGVILGCTELPMIINGSMTKLALFDSATLLAVAALDRAIDSKVDE
jgi:aspartate racemase